MSFLAMGMGNHDRASLETIWLHSTRERFGKFSLVPDPLGKDHYGRGRDENIKPGDYAMLMLDGKETKPK